MFARAAVVLAGLMFVTGCADGKRASAGPTVASISAPPTTPSVVESEVQRVLGQRAAHTSTMLSDGRVLVAGGCVVDGCSRATDGTVVLSADGQTATSGAFMSTPRSSHTASLLPDRRLMLVGGFPGEGLGVTDRVDLYDPASGRMVSAPPLRQPRGGHAAVTLVDGRVLVVGGWVSSGRYTSSAEVIDPAKGSTTVADLPWSADALEAVLLNDGRVLVMGGQVAPGVGTKQSAVFEPSTGTWSSTPSMTTARLKHFAVVLRDGRVFVMGGSPDDSDRLASTEIFDPATGAFVAGPEMLERRYKFPGGAVVLADGRVLVAGGGHRAEIVDIDAMTSSAVGHETNRQASFATVNVLSQRKAIVIGGYDDNIQLVDALRFIDIPH